MLRVVLMMLITHVHSSCVEPWQIDSKSKSFTANELLRDMSTTVTNFLSKPDKIQYQGSDQVKMNNSLQVCIEDTENCKLHTIYDLKDKTITLCNKFGKTRTFCIKIQCKCLGQKKRRREIKPSAPISEKMNTSRTFGYLRLDLENRTCKGWEQQYNDIVDSINCQNTRNNVPTNPTTKQCQIPDHSIQISTLQQSQSADYKTEPNNSSLERLIEESRWYLIGMFFTGLIIGSIISTCLTCVVLKRSSERKISKAVANKLYSMEMGNFSETVEQNPNIYSYAEIKDTSRDERNCSQRNCLNIETDDTYMIPVPKKDLSCVSRSVYHQVNCIDTSNTSKDENIKSSLEGQLNNSKYSRKNETSNDISCEAKHLLDQGSHIYNHLTSNFGSPQTIEKNGCEFSKSVADISSSVYGRLKPIVDPDVTEEDAINTKNAYMELEEVQRPVLVNSEEYLMPSCAAYHTFTVDSGRNCLSDNENSVQSQIPREEQTEMSTTLSQNQTNVYNVLDKDVDSCIQEQERMGCDDAHEDACEGLKMEPFTGYHEKDSEAQAQHYTFCNDMLHCSKAFSKQSDPTFNQLIESNETENAYFLLEKE